MSKYNLDTAEGLNEVFEYAAKVAEGCDTWLVSITVITNHCCLNCLRAHHEVISITTEGSCGIFEELICSECGKSFGRKRLEKRRN